MKNKTCIQVFAKAPIAGLCKTRLASSIGHEKALELYKEMLSGVVNTASMLADIDIQVWCKPVTEHAFFKYLVDQYSVTLHVQQGTDLGDIMLNALQQSRQNGYRNILQLGADCPLITVAYLDEAINLLDNNEIVLGPAEDGGYVMLASRIVDKSLFTSINWGTSSVLASLETNIDELGYQYVKMDSLFDIDDYHDYKRYLELTGQDDEIEGLLGAIPEKSSIT